MQHHHKSDSDPVQKFRPIKTSRTDTAVSTNDALRFNVRFYFTHYDKNKVLIFGVFSSSSDVFEFDAPDAPELTDQHLYLMNQLCDDTNCRRLFTKLKEKKKESQKPSFDFLLLF